MVTRWAARSTAAVSTGARRPLSFTGGAGTGLSRAQFLGNLRRSRLHHLWPCRGGLRDLGPTMAPMNAYLTITGIETLPCAWPGIARTPPKSPVSSTKTAAFPGSPTPVWRTIRTMTGRRATAARRRAVALRVRRTTGRPSTPAIAVPFGQYRRYPLACFAPGLDHPSPVDGRATRRRRRQ